jgi:hypothetical protein
MEYLIESSKVRKTKTGNPFLSVTGNIDPEYLSCGTRYNLFAWSTKSNEVSIYNLVANPKTVTNEE